MVGGALSMAESPTALLWHHKLAQILAAGFKFQFSEYRLRECLCGPDGGKSWTGFLLVGESSEKRQDVRPDANIAILLLDY